MPSNAVDCRARDWGIESRHARSSRPVVTMTNSPPPGLPSSDVVSDRLDSWKEIAGYLKRDVTTVQRWEKREGMPVHRHLHDKMGSVYAFRTELDAWARGRNLGVAAEQVPVLEDAQPPAIQATPRWWLGLWLLAATGALISAGFMFWHLQQPPDASVNPLAEARFQQ